MSDGSSEPQGVSQRTKTLLGLLAEAFTLRCRLLSMELEAERKRFFRSIIWLCVCLLSLGMTVILLTGLVLILLWPDHSIEALTALSLLYLSVGGFAVWRLHYLGTHSPGLLDATIGTLSDDLDQLFNRK